MKNAKEKGYVIPVIKRINNYRSKVGFCKVFIPDKNGSIRVSNELGNTHIWKFSDTKINENYKESLESFSRLKNKVN